MTDSNGRFEPGEKRPEGAGRKPGTPNKLTKSVKEAIEQAFDEVGGVDYLVKTAYIDRKAFLALVGKLLPKDIKLDAGAGLAQLLDAILKKRSE